ncbi:alpha/beta fold hydrolase [Mycobacterium sp. URHB0021]
MAYRDSLGLPAGAPLMLLHGVGITADLNWSPAYAELCQRFRVVAPDLPGHGRGIRPWPTFSLEKCADHIVVLADWLGIDRFIACGYSMGSLVAQLIWRRHPDRVSALVLGATSRNFMGSPTERLISSLSPAFAVAAKSNPLLRLLHADAFGTGYLNDIDDESRRYVRAEMSLTSMSTVTAALVAVAAFTSHTWIGDVDVPVSVLVTTRDSVVPPGRQMKLAEAIPHATVVTVEGDHDVFVASPRLFTEKILEACQAVTAARPWQSPDSPWPSA